MAASSVRRVWRIIQPITSRPTPADSAAPIRSPGRNRPSPPSATITMKARPIPGKVACEIASDTSARLRRNMKLPVTPAAMPSKVAPIATSVAL